LNSHLNFLTLCGDRWKLLILRDLLTGTKRFGELKKSLDGISQEEYKAKPDS
jgi:DNA-binding HxlR family transcriptional regulator